MRTRYVLSGLALSTLIACSGGSDRADTRAANAPSVVPPAQQAAVVPPDAFDAPAPAPQGPRVLAALQTRDRTVRIFADKGALQVTVHDDAGNLVADRVALERLRAIDPFLYEACTSALVSAEDAARGMYIDARLDLAR